MPIENHDVYIQLSSGRPVILSPPHVLSNHRIEVQTPERFFTLSQSEALELAAALRKMADET